MVAMATARCAGNGAKTSAADRVRVIPRQDSAPRVSFALVSSPPPSPPDVTPDALADNNGAYYHKKTYHRYQPNRLSRWLR